MLDALIQHQANAYRASTSVVNELNKQFTNSSNAFVSDLRDILDDLTESERIALTSGKYTTNRLKDFKDAFDVWFQSISVSLPELFLASAASYAAVEVAFIAGLYGESAHVSESSVIKSFKNAPVAGGLLFDDLFTDLAESTRKQALYAVRNGINTGLSNQEIIAELRGKRTKVGDTYEYVGGIVEQAKNKIEANVRTARSALANVAYDDTFTALGYEYRKFMSTLDGRTTYLCASLDGTIWKKGDPSMRVPPLHFNCLLGDSHVLTVGGVSGASKRWFDGEIFIIKTSRGRELRCTPNHPILTRSGWVSASAINVGSDIVCDLVGEWKGLVDSNHKNIPPLIKDVVHSVFSSSKVLTMPVPVSAKDFHGDGVGSEVAIVASNSFLRNGFYPSFKKHLSKNDFTIRLPKVNFLLDRLGSLAQRLNRNGPVLGSNVGVSSKLFDFFFGVTSHSSKLLLRSVSKGDSMLFKNRFCGSYTNSDSIHHSSNTNSRIKCGDNILLCFPRISKLIHDVLCRSASNFGFNKVSSNNIANCVNAKPSLSGDVNLRKSIFVHSGDNFTGFWGADRTLNELVSAIKDNVCDDGLINSNGFGNGENGLSSIIGFDDVVSIERKNFSGHVYNLETDDGYYVANGIITHNCRSILVGVDKDGNIAGKRPFVASDRPVSKIPKDEREGIIGQVNANTKFPNWFAKQDEAFQRGWLGNDRYKLYKEGGYKIEKFIDPLGKEYSLKELKELDEKTFKKLGLK